MFSILDRYVSRVFFAYFFVCLLGGIGLYTVIDVGAQLHRFIRGGVGKMGLSILTYTLWNAPVVVCVIFPPLLLISAGWALVQMAKSNELIAIKASGLSVYRVIIPLFIGGAVIGLGVACMREWLIPVLAPKITAASGAEKETGKGLGISGKILNGDEVIYFRMAGYNMEKKRMDRPMFLVLSKMGFTKIVAERGQAVDGQWFLYDAHIIKGAGEKEDKDETITEKYILPFLLRPEDITAHQISSGLMSTRQLKKLIQRQPTNLKLRVEFHQRFTYPFTGLILLLIGLPFVVGFERVSRSRILGLGMCIVVCAAFYAVTFLCTSLGGSSHLPTPWLAAWLPSILFAAVGIFLFDMIST